jgi:hypothetical protein
LGLSSEEVCEIGKWKNSTAFANHYLRLGAVNRAREALEKSPQVHNVSSLRSEATDLMRTPPRIPESGGSIREGDEQNKDEPSRPALERVRKNLKPRKLNRRADEPSLRDKEPPPVFRFAKPLTPLIPLPQPPTADSSSDATFLTTQSPTDKHRRE